jgi:hypothetical protein
MARLKRLITRWSRNSPLSPSNWQEKWVNALIAIGTVGATFVGMTSLIFSQKALQDSHDQSVAAMQAVNISQKELSTTLQALEAQRGQLVTEQQNYELESRPVLVVGCNLDSVPDSSDPGTGRPVPTHSFFVGESEPRSGVQQFYDGNRIYVFPIPFHLRPDNSVSVLDPRLTILLRTSYLRCSLSNEGRTAAVGIVMLTTLAPSMFDPNAVFHGSPYLLNVGSLAAGASLEFSLFNVDQHAWRVLFSPKVFIRDPSYAMSGIAISKLQHACFFGEAPNESKTCRPLSDVSVSNKTLNRAVKIKSEFFTGNGKKRIRDFLRFYKITPSPDLKRLTS